MNNLMPVFRSHCKNCTDFYESHGYKCSMKCFVKGSKRIKPIRISAKEYSRVLENNIGITVSLTSMYKYIKEIKSFIEKK